MSAPRESKLPSLLPFVVAALVLVVIYGGLLLFPTIRALVDRQIASPLRAPTATRPL